MSLAPPVFSSAMNGCSSLCMVSPSAADETLWVHPQRSVEQESPVGTYAPYKGISRFPTSLVVFKRQKRPRMSLRYRARLIWITLIVPWALVWFRQSGKTGRDWGIQNQLAGGASLMDSAGDPTFLLAFYVVRCRQR
jgi:hypothetical protein